MRARARASATLAADGNAILPVTNQSMTAY